MCCHVPAPKTQRPYILLLEREHPTCPPHPPTVVQSLQALSCELRFESCHTLLPDEDDFQNSRRHGGHTHRGPDLRENEINSQPASHPERQTDRRETKEIQREAHRHGQDLSILVFSIFEIKTRERQRERQALMMLLCCCLLAVRLEV